MTPTPAAVRPGPWWADLFSSLVVFLVALPLCLGIAQACGLPPLAGIVTGVIGGLVVGLLAGSPLQVSGPAAGLIVLVIQFLDAAEAAGTPRAEAVTLLGVTTALAGLIQVAAGALRLGPWFRAVSPAVVEGMLAGIGVTIIAKQFHDMVDDEAPKKIVEGLLTIPAAVWKGIDPPAGAKASHQAAALIGVVTILVLALWKPLAPTRLKLVPAAVVAVLAAAGIAEGGGLGVERVSVEGNLLGAFAPPAWPGWAAVGSKVVLVGAVTFALIASAESLLCATAVDTMHSGPRTNYNRELMAQGVGNVLCGAVAALPMTGVIVRSSANVEAGARTRASTFLHGAWLLLFVALLPGLLSLIPGSALAAVLVYTGWKLLNLLGLVRLWKVSPSEALIFAATAATIVGFDLLTGVVTGIVLSAVKLLVMFSHLSVTRRDDPDQNRVELVLDGAATFLRLPLLAEALEAVPPGRRLHVRLDGLRFVDHAVMQLLTTFRTQYEATGGRVVLDWAKLHAQFRDPQEPTATPAPRAEPGSRPRPAAALTPRPHPAH